MSTIDCKRDRIKDIPSTIGVYLFVNKREILYIGKSINLKARIASHFENAKIDSKENAIIQNSKKIRLIILDSEFKALLLESSLIQKYEPRYNRIWRDDKSYLYVKINMKDTYPKIAVVRKENDHMSLYFGPFASTRLVNELLFEIRKVFPFCQQKKLGKSSCFYNKIGLCNPCPSAIENSQDQKLKEDLKRKYRCNIKKIIKIFQGKTDLLLNGLYQSLRKMSKNENYEEAIQIRNRIFSLERLINDRLSLDYDLSLPQNREQAGQSLRNQLIKYLPNLKKIEKIECYDISNLGNKISTGSMVVFVDGIVNKSEYRKFKIKNPSLNSDFKMLQEIIRRRFTNKWQKPDLLAVDGGKPQVRIVVKTLKDMRLDIPVIGIAKNPDRLIIGTTNLPTIRFDLNNQGFNLIRLLRDESHRFARKYHLFLREKKLI